MLNLNYKKENLIGKMNKIIKTNKRVQRKKKINI
jgi:hypothetical protein